MKNDVVLYKHKVAIMLLNGGENLIYDNVKAICKEKNIPISRFPLIWDMEEKRRDAVLKSYRERMDW